MLVRDQRLPSYKNQLSFSERAFEQKLEDAARWCKILALIFAIGMLVAFLTQQRDLGILSALVTGFTTYMHFGFRFESNYQFLPHGVHATHCQKVSRALKAALFPWVDSLSSWFTRENSSQLSLDSSLMGEVMDVLSNEEMREEKAVSQMSLREVVDYAEKLKRAYAYSGSSLLNLKNVKAKLKRVKERLHELLVTIDRYRYLDDLVEKEAYYASLIEAGVSREVALQYFRRMSGFPVEEIPCTEFESAKAILVYYQLISPYLTAQNMREEAFFQLSILCRASDTPN